MIHKHEYANKIFLWDTPIISSSFWNSSPCRKSKRVGTNLFQDFLELQRIQFFVLMRRPRKFWRPGPWPQSEDGQLLPMSLLWTLETIKTNTTVSRQQRGSRSPLWSPDTLTSSSRGDRGRKGLERMEMKRNTWRRVSSILAELLRFTVCLKLWRKQNQTHWLNLLFLEMEEVGFLHPRF